MYCRNCNEKCHPVLDLGKIKPFTFVQPEPEPIPLVLERCPSCTLVQLGHTINLDDAYRQYWYRSALNKSMVDSLWDIVDDIESKIELKPNDIVIDIGTNDGTLFDFYTKDVIKIGFDPALNIDNNHADVFINNYFKPIDVKAKVVTSIAMFYDLPDPNAFIEDVKAVLHDDGIWVIQLTDLYSMFAVNAFDNICAEHLEYYSLFVLVNMMARHGLQVFHVSRNQVNGGSIRCFISKNRHPDGTVANALSSEFKLFQKENFVTFKNRIDEIGRTIHNILENYERIFLLGASTKGNTLIQYYGIAHYFQYAAEVNPDKFGLFYCGVPIIPEQEAIEMQPDLFFTPIWHFKENIIRNHPDQRILFPLPRPVLYNG